VSRCWCSNDCCGAGWCAPRSGCSAAH